MQQPSKQTYVHPMLGTLTNVSDDVWTGKVEIGHWGGDVWRPKVSITLIAPEDRFKRGVEMLCAIVGAGSGLGEVIRRGVWAELVGEETEGRYWWSGDLSRVNEVLDEPLTGPDDLIRVMNPTVLCVMPDFHGDEELTGCVGCHCDFEEEHGFDVLTDGQRVLGTGYSGEARKYERFSKLTDAEIDARSDAMWAEMDRRQAQGE
ncbi:MAG: hypothetical protein AAF916_12805 [Planctomycetota bacterium]